MSVRECFGRTVQSESVVIVSESHCNRTLRGLRTSSVPHAKEFMLIGSEIQSVELVLRHPEVRIFDLSNPDEIWSNLGCEEVLELFERLRDKTRLRAEVDSNISLIFGDDLLPEKLHIGGES